MFSRGYKCTSMLQFLPHDMLFFTLLISLMAYAYGRSEESPRIVHGESTIITEAPYQIALLNRLRETFYLICGGSIIGRSVVLTAAHCTHGNVAGDLRVRAGSNFHNAGGQLVNVSSIIQHPEYKQPANDIALLFLAWPLSLGRGVAIIALPPQDQPIPDGCPVVVTGWGLEAEKLYPPPDHLRKVTLISKNQKECETAMREVNIHIDDNMFCSGPPDHSSKGTCNGDSGGPQVMDGILVGISSWVVECGDGRYPGVSARVASFRNWIDSHVSGQEELSL